MSVLDLVVSSLSTQGAKMKDICNRCKQFRDYRGRSKLVAWKDKKYHSTCLREMRFPPTVCAYCFKGLTDGDRIKSGHKTYHKKCLGRKRAVYRRNRPRKVSNFNSVKK